MSFSLEEFTAANRAREQKAIAKKAEASRQALSEKKIVKKDTTRAAIKETEIEKGYYGSDLYFEDGNEAKGSYYHDDY